MVDVNFLSDDGFRRINTMHKVLKILRREGKCYLTALHYRCGVGFTVEQFEQIVKALAERDWCQLKQGGQGATLVVFNEAFESVNVPEMVAS